MLRATPPEVLRADLDRYDAAPPPAVRALRADPVAGLRRLADEITAYWEIALAPDWARIRLLLEAEVQHRARRLATDGADGLLNDLHQRVRWEGETLSIAQRHCTTADVPDGSGLVLVPSVFVWPSVLSVAQGTPPQLAYPARGSARSGRRAPGPPTPSARYWAGGGPGCSWRCGRRCRPRNSPGVPGSRPAGCRSTWPCCGPPGW
ncbi:DUF5937 family protein [Plantactinospora sp. B24E8]|uniref:DUF5937 family protein n=1 Tax=Plantactinospora sp. B24E8 TaxID=3153567 RepID=UPI00325FD664